MRTKSQPSGWLNLPHLPIPPPPLTAKQRVIIIPDQSEEGIDGYGRKGSENEIKTRLENATRKVNKRSMIGVWRWRRAGWWWRIELIRNTKSRRKLVPQVRCGIPEGPVCDVETEVNWLKRSNACVCRLSKVSSPVVRYLGLSTGDSLLRTRHRGCRLHVLILLLQRHARLFQSGDQSDVGWCRHMGLSAGTLYAEKKIEESYCAP